MHLAAHAAADALRDVQSSKQEQYMHIYVLCTVQPKVALWYVL